MHATGLVDRVEGWHSIVKRYKPTTIGRSRRKDGVAHSLGRQSRMNYAGHALLKGTPVATGISRVWDIPTA